MEFPEYLRSLQQAEVALADAYIDVAQTRSDDQPTVRLFLALARQGQEHARALEPLLERYDRLSLGSPAPNAMAVGAVEHPRVHLPVLEFQDLYLSACLVDVGWTVLMQVGSGLEDRDLVRVVEHCASETGKQLAWIKTQIKHASHATLLQSSRHHRRPPQPARRPVAACPGRDEP